MGPCSGHGHFVRVPWESAYESFDCGRIYFGIRIIRLRRIMRLFKINTETLKKVVDEYNYDERDQLLELVAAKIGEKTVRKWVMFDMF